MLWQSTPEMSCSFHPKAELNKLLPCIDPVLPWKYVGDASGSVNIEHLLQLEYQPPIILSKFVLKVLLQ